MLHLVSKSPYCGNHLEHCLKTCAENDIIVLLEEGVYATPSDTQWVTGFARIQGKNDVKIFAIEADLRSRGITQAICSNITLINYEQFVNLTVSHYPIQNW